jgi:PPM family protein phosphatase
LNDPTEEPPASLAPFVQAAGRSHPGWVRGHNEDAFVAEPERGLFAVIDGMGGEKAGEVAAGISARQIGRAEPGTDGLVAAVQAANEEILQEGLSDAEKQGMGCVLTAVSLVADRLHWVHVGDTRAYLGSAVGCERLTRDHSAVAELQETMGLSEAEARILPGQHQVTRDLGREHHQDDSWIDRGEADFQEGDLLVLCSDGLSDLVVDVELRRLIATARRLALAPSAIAERLEKLALDRGGLDNVTVVVVRRLAGHERTGDPDTLPPRPSSETLAAGSLFGRFRRLFRRRR